MHKHLVHLGLILERDEEPRMIQPILGESHSSDRVILGLIVLKKIDFWELFIICMLFDAFVAGGHA